jgi:hypothetical protein
MFSGTGRSRYYGAVGLGRLGTGWLPTPGVGRLRLAVLDRTGWMGVD